LSHKDKIQERSKKRRKLIADFVQRSQQLTVFAESALKQRRYVREKVEDYGNELERIYGKPESFHIEVFIRNFKTPISYGTFTMLLLYFTPQELLPNPLATHHNPAAKALDFLPTESHYRQLSKLIHPDRYAQFAEYSSLANASWELCKKVLADPKLKDALVPPSPNLFPAPNAEYCRQGDVFKQLSDLFYAYYSCWCEVSNSLNPSMLTPCTLYRSLLATAESRNLLNASLDDEDTGMRDLEDGIEDVIAQGKEFASLPRSGRKRNAEPEQELDDELEKEEEEDEEEDGSSRDALLSGGNNKQLGTERIDPSLRWLPTAIPLSGVIVDMIY
jgi:hypothetical protein